jgi:site-specific DNA-cytosine methylase
MTFLFEERDRRLVLIALRGKEPRTQIRMKQYTVLGVSAGNGVMLHPFKDQHILANIEVRKDYYINKDTPQWDLNFPGTPLLNHLPKSLKEVDVIIGHPKCGQSSMLALSRGKSFKSHQGEPSLEIFLESIDLYEPKIFFLENLPKLLDTHSLEDLKGRFPDYNISQIIDSVSRWGNSQINRKRLLLIGYQMPMDWMQTQFLKMFGTQIPLSKTGALLKNLPDNGHIREDLDDRIAIYGGKQMTFREIKAYWDANPRQKRFETDNHLGSAPGVYRNLADDYPATVRKGNREFNPRGLPMSPRERARIQGIPDDFLILDDGPYSEKSLINKGRITVGSSPPYEIGLWAKKVCDSLFAIE